jgi:hypothetical protein
MCESWRGEADELTQVLGEERAPGMVASRRLFRSRLVGTRLQVGRYGVS